ncbi:NLP/P60 family protein [hydrothermal vent metagenome]|uniref:NLP/P60 family protein n=1 Tax=hydrothermal vent metagenome TaxID=652676 RepID=A0A1W1BX27_9ZZZZ
MLRESYGKRYRWAEEGPRSFDCSGLTYYTYGSMNIWLPRRAIEQSRYGRSVSIKRLRYGDLIFFDTRKRPRGKVNHVGIYVGNNHFIHASSSKKRVIRSSLKKRFYRNRVVVCKRVIPSKYYNQCITKKRKKLKRYKHKSKYKPKRVKKAKAKSIQELFDNIDINKTSKIIEDETKF